MKNLKKYFNVIVTAVICFFMGMIPRGKKDGEAVKILTAGQAVCPDTGSHMKSGYKSHEYERNVNSVVLNVKKRENDASSKEISYLHKKLHWLQGPGDRTVRDLYNLSG